MDIYGIATAVFVLLLFALVPVLRIGFGASWLWATAPVWIAVVLLVLAIIVFYVLVMRHGLFILDETDGME